MPMPRVGTTLFTNCAALRVTTVHLLRGQKRNVSTHKTKSTGNTALTQGQQPTKYTNLDGNTRPLGSDTMQCGYGVAIRPHCGQLPGVATAVRRDECTDVCSGIPKPGLNVSVGGTPGRTRLGTWV